ncbi:hypothetical protein [Anaerosalibacter sp. Marseille-P3206]|uniref:hypothetical protein n=1 Tax=Anaerosalibacter sp. Marseille-P3206 TaxID=1871005 RepID=UPI001356317E|nr:hypothetical protein [Anaerosalibacter sp. Marseille-P3206]
MAVGIIFTLIAIVLTILQLSLISYAKKNLIIKKINVLNISQNDEDGLIVTYLTYFVPFLEGYIGKTFSKSTWVLIAGGVLLMILSRKTVYNPILHVLGYKIYSIETNYGVDLKLLTKKDLRNTRSVTQVIRIFENLVMEV